MSLRRKKSSLENAVLSGMSISKIIQQNKRMYASSTSWCNRQGVLQANYTATEIQEPKTTGYFAVGLAIEEIVLNSLFAKNQLLFSQYDIPDIDLNLGGRIDGIYRLENEPIKIIEVKSCGSIPSSPNKEHEAQALLYSAILGLPSALFYMSRNIADKDGNVLIRSFDIDFNWLDRYQMIYNIVYAFYCNQNNVMPDIPTHITDINQCGFCRFKEICWNNKKSHLESVHSLDAGTQQSIRLLSEVFAEEFMSESAIDSRRNGVLKHISKNGTGYARTLLENTDWSELVLTL